MPSKFVTRNLKENSYYHIYQRGIEGRNIFLSQPDYEKFLYYLYIYTAAPIKIAEKYPDLPTRLKLKNLSEDIFLIAYCLLPDHFHIIIRQKTVNAMPKLIKQVLNAYMTYFNKKYKKSGTIFKGRYKSTLIESEYLLTQMVRFVHLNPSTYGYAFKIKEYPWSSYSNDTFAQGLMNRFGTREEWEKFHEDRTSYETNFAKIKSLTID